MVKFHPFLVIACLALPVILLAEPILPIRIQGAAGGGSKAALARAGANSFRTWDVDDKTGDLLDEAQANGLKVMLGIWLGHERHGFDYTDFDQITKQREKVRKAVEAHKDHPAVLCWALGNEMEGFGAGDNPAIWGHLDSLASMVKKMDPKHPVATVIAEIGGRKVEAVHKLCPNIDILGINSYGGAKSLPRRYREAGGTKPYVVTEYGPNGTWETKKTSFGAVPEETSTQKAKRYGGAFVALQADELCLGSYAFTWGYKQEGTATWFGMLLPGGRHLGAVDTLQELWTGKPPANRCPTVQPLEIQAHGANITERGRVLTILLDAKDPEGETLKTEWILMDESQYYNTGGDFRESPNSFPDAILESSATSAKIRMPDNGGTYRIYATVTDPNNGAATANLPLFVKGPRKTPPAEKVAMPFTPIGKYYPTGWMGNTASMDLKEGESLHFQYKANDNWGGIVWQHPPNDWGDKPGGYDLSGANRLTFRAKGRQGGEVATFSIGIIGKDKPHHDSSKTEKKVILSPEWKTYTLDLSGKDLSRIKSGFCITVAGQGRPLSIEIADLQYE